MKCDVCQTKIPLGATECPNCGYARKKGTNYRLNTQSQTTQRSQGQQTYKPVSRPQPVNNNNNVLLKILSVILCICMFIPVGMTFYYTVLDDFDGDYFKEAYVIDEDYWYMVFDDAKLSDVYIDYYVSDFSSEARIMGDYDNGYVSLTLGENGYDDDYVDLYIKKGNPAVAIDYAYYEELLTVIGNSIDEPELYSTFIELKDLALDNEETSASGYLENGNYYIEYSDDMTFTFQYFNSFE